MVQIAKIVQPPKAGLGILKEKSQVKFMTSSMHSKGTAAGTGGLSVGVKGAGYLGDNPFVALPMESFDQRRIRNKAATAQLMDWFLSEWATWQRHGLLCGLAKRSSLSQTKYLLSALEPVFHQDYLLQAGGLYPWQWIGKGKKPIKLEKVDKKRYKRTRLLKLAKQRLKEKPNHLKNIRAHLETPTPAQDQRSSREKLILKKQDSVHQLKLPVDPKSGRSSESGKATETPRVGLAGGEGGASRMKFDVGRQKWLKLKTVQMLDPSTLLGDKDRGLAIRELLVDGLGIWDATQLRRSLPPFLSSTSTPGGHLGHLQQHRQHFMLKSAALAQTRTSRRVDFQREYTKSSMSFRTENMYTPGGGFERGLPKNREEMKKVKAEYKKQLRVIYQWMGSMTESEMGEALGSILINTSNADLRFLTSCLIKRDNESFDVNHLTDSLLLNIFQYLQPKDLQNATQVCSRWFYLCSLEQLWQRHCLQLGKQFMIESLEELVDVFQLDNTNFNMPSSLEGDTHPTVPPPAPLESVSTPLPPVELSSIDWKYAYEELYAVISEAVRQLNEEAKTEKTESGLVNNYLLLTQQTNQPIKSIEGNEEKDKNVGKDGVAIRKRVLPVIHVDPDTEDKWLKREVEYLYGDLIQPKIEKERVKEDKYAIYYTGINNQDDASTTLSDLYDIDSLMCRKDKWKINLGSSTREGNKGGEGNDSFSMGSDTVVQELALQMGGKGIKEKGDECESETEVSSLRLYAAEDRVASTEGAIEGGREELGEGAVIEDDESIGDLLRRHSLYSFERLEIKEFQEWKSREAFLLMKQRRMESKISVSSRSRVDKQEIKKTGAKYVPTLDPSLLEAVDPRSGRVECPSRMTGQFMEPGGFQRERDEGRGSLVEEGSQKMERNEYLEDDFLRSQLLKKAKLPRQVEEHRKDEMIEQVLVETLSETVAAPKTGKPGQEGAARKGEGTAVVPRAIQLQTSERDEFGYPIIQMDRAMVGQIALDIRPPATQSKDLLSSLNKCMYDVEWKYPKKPQNRRKRAKYQNRILAIKQLKILHGHLEAVLCMKLGWGRLMTGSIDQSLRVWCAGSGRSMHKLCGHKGSVSAVDFNEDWIVTGSWDMTIIVWNSPNYKYHKTLFGHQAKVSCLYLREHFLFSGSHDSCLRMWDVDNGFVCLKVYECPSPLTSITLLPLLPKNRRKVIREEDEHRNLPNECLFTSFDGVIRILDLKHDKWVELSGHNREVSCLKVTGDLIISGSFDGQVRFWNKRSLECESAIRAHSQAVFCLEFHRRKFYTGSEDSTIKEWDLHTMTCMRILHGHKGPVRSLKVSDRRIISCSDDSEIRFWELYDPLEVK